MEIKSFYAETSTGPYLALNEDVVITDIPNRLFGIVDGFGGVGIGDKAADIVADSVKKLALRISGDENATMPFYFNEQALLETNAVVNSLYLAQNELKKAFKEKDLSQRGGASVLVGIASDNNFIFTNVGNCRAFLIRNSRIVEINTPDIVDANYAFRDKYTRTFPLNALGLYEHFSFSVNEVHIQEGDCFILMTDGCYSSLDSKDIKSIMFDSTLMLNEKAEKLLALANQQGNLDNQSLVLVQY